LNQHLNGIRNVHTTDFGVNDNYLNNSDMPWHVATLNKIIS
jgi:hypothetical protein